MDAEVDPAALVGVARRRMPRGDEDLLIREEPLMLHLAGHPLLTMRTPGQDKELAVGFALAEGLMTSIGDLKDVTSIPADATTGMPDTVQLSVAGELTAMVRARLTRTHEIRSSCGLCGIGSVDALLDDLPPLLPGVPVVTKALLIECVANLSALQPLFKATGACHGAVLFSADGTVLGRGEDVGRHNAVDKAIGQAAMAGADLRRAIAVLSGRAGYDLVTKCLRVQVPIIVSVSGASAAAFDICVAAGATLAGFARGQDVRLYCGGQRIVGP